MTQKMRLLMINFNLLSMEDVKQLVNLEKGSKSEKLIFCICKEEKMFNNGKNKFSFS